MTSLFASPDIAALVAAFPPPLPTRSQPSLVRSHSGNNLVNSEAILRGFRTLLENEPQKIKLADLPRRLDISNADWILDCYDGEPRIRWSRQKTSIVPDPEWRTILEKLSSECDNFEVSAESFAKENDIEAFGQHDLKALKESHNLTPLPFNSDATKSIAGPTLMDKIRQEINSAITNSNDGKVDLLRLFRSHSYTILSEVAKELIPPDQLEIGRRSIVYTPPGFSSAQAKKVQADREARLQALMETFENDDYVQIRIHYKADDVDADEIRKRYTGLHADVEAPTILDTENAAKLVILPSLLDRTMREMKDITRAVVSNSNTSVPVLLGENFESDIASKSDQPELATQILKNKSCFEQVSSTLQEALAQRETERHEYFGVMCRRELFALAQLYAAGVELVTDPKLKQSLNEYTCSYFKDEVIPAFVKTAREQELLSDKAKAKESDKLLERSKESKGLEDLVGTLGKFAKKVKLDLPTENDRRQLRNEILEKKALKEMPKMSRGSDVLQNLTWILLSAACERSTTSADDTETTNGDGISQPDSTLALFMSPGKDTGRMIKQYSTLAPEDTETSEKLAAWREKLKAGSESKEDLEEMRVLAKEIVGRLLEHRSETNANGAAT